MVIRWLIGFFILFVVLVIVSNIIEAQDPLTDETITILELALGYQSVSASDPTGGTFSGLAMLPTAVGAIWDALIFNYPFFNASFIAKMVRYILFLPCTIGMFFTLALTIRQVISGK
jgi:hypothetical protein